MILSFEVPGVPVGKARPRVTRNGTYVPKRTKQYMDTIREAYGWRYLFDGPVFMEVYAWFPMPKRMTKRDRKRIEELDYLYTHKPDGDNVLKAVKDALNGMAYADDAQVAYESILRKYAREGEAPRIEVVLYDQKGGRIDAE